MTRGSAVAQALALETFPSLLLGAGGGHAALAAGLAPTPSFALGVTAFALCHVLLAQFAKPAAKAEATAFTLAELAFPIDADVEMLETLLLDEPVTEPDLNPMQIPDMGPALEPDPFGMTTGEVDRSPARVDPVPSPRAFDADSRVVQLFDPQAGPTAGELSERIDRHLASPGSRPIPDASAELRDALSALRQSLR